MRLIITASGTEFCGTRKGLPHARIISVHADSPLFSVRSFPERPEKDGRNIGRLKLHIVLLDLMPVLWVMSAAAALLLFWNGERGAPIRTLPAVCMGLSLYCADFPPRMQVLAFAGVYLLCALIWWVYIRLSAVRGKKNGILHRKRAEGSDV